MASLLYLMGSSDTDADEYYGETDRCEDLVSWSRWETACEYITELASKTSRVAAVSDIVASSLMENGGSTAEKIALIIKGWHLYSEGKKLTKTSLKLKYIFDEDDGVHHLIDEPTCGGIDLGQGSDEYEPAPSPEELEKRKTQERLKRDSKRSA